MFNATSKVADCFSWRRSVSTFSLAKRNGIYRFAALVLSQNGAEAFLYLRWMISFIYHLHLLAVSFHFTFFYLFFFIIIIFFFGRRASRIYLEAVWIIDPILPRGELWQLLLALLESILEFRMVNNRLEFAMLTNSNVNHNRSIVNENLLEWDGTGAVAKSNWINLIWRISFLKNLKKKIGVDWNSWQLRLWMAHGRQRNHQRLSGILFGEDRCWLGHPYRFQPRQCHSTQ